jgi:hypothetical protein
MMRPTLCAVDWALAWARKIAVLASRCFCRGPGGRDRTWLLSF